MTSTPVQEIMAAELVAKKVKQSTQTKSEGSDDATFATLRITNSKIKSVFALFDADDTGMLLAHDLDLILRSLAIQVDDEAMEGLNTKADGMADEGRLTYDQLLTLLKDVAESKSTDEEHKRAFQGLAGAQGEEAAPATAITFESLKTQLMATEARVSDDEIREVLKYCDVDGDGNLSEKDFLEVMDFTNKMQL